MPASSPWSAPATPAATPLQGLKLTDGRTVAEAVADQVAELGERSVGERGYSLLGAVVGATKPADAVALRKRMPKQFFLVPGYGAQGGGADDVRACFNPDGTGALITASRSVIYASGSGSGNWTDAVRARRGDPAGRDCVHPGLIRSRKPRVCVIYFGDREVSAFSSEGCGGRACRKPPRG